MTDCPLLFSVGLKPISGRVAHFQQLHRNRTETVLMTKENNSKSVLTITVQFHGTHQEQFGEVRD